MARKKVKPKHAELRVEKWTRLFGGADPAIEQNLRSAQTEPACVCERASRPFVG